jgi:hypothetical protein
VHLLVKVAVTWEAAVVLVLVELHQHLLEVQLHLKHHLKLVHRLKLVL